MTCPVSPILAEAGSRPLRLAALDGHSLKIVGWRPVTGEA
jgi:hypothetical protein